MVACAESALSTRRAAARAERHPGRSLPLLTEFRNLRPNTPATLSPASAGDAHNWRVFIA